MARTEDFGQVLMRKADSYQDDLGMVLVCADRRLPNRLGMSRESTGNELGVFSTRNR